MPPLPQQIVALRAEFLEELKTASHSRELEALKVKYLGKKGPIQALMVALKGASPEERPQLGKEINDLKGELSSHLEEALQSLKNLELEARLKAEWIDIALPGRKGPIGRPHPITQTMERILAILQGMGFSIQLGPDVESDVYNFEGLNFAKDHPAREMQDTFYLQSEKGALPDLLLRTHTSNTQVHAMEQFKPPMRVVAPGRCFRNEDISARSHVFFHQIEGFYIDRHVTFADLFATMEELFVKLFGVGTKTRFRPSYFPFVEPGVEVDVWCTACKGSGCRICKQSGWLEILGAGMIHPEVLRKRDIDPEIYSGYAWGMGVERLTMLLHKIGDIRLFTENDLRFLEQFP